MLTLLHTHTHTAAAGRVRTSLHAGWDQLLQAGTSSSSLLG